MLKVKYSQALYFYRKKDSLQAMISALYLSDNNVVYKSRKLVNRKNLKNVFSA